MKTTDLILRLQRGDKMHMQIINGRRVWWFEAPHINIPDHVVSAVLKADEALIREAGDSLFGLPLNSQTWENGDG